MVFSVQCPRKGQSHETGPKQLLRPVQYFASTAGDEEGQSNTSDQYGRAELE